MGSLASCWCRGGLGCPVRSCWGASSEACGLACGACSGPTTAAVPPFSSFLETQWSIAPASVYSPPGRLVCVATGITPLNYAQLPPLLEQFPSGFSIVAFPCNQFRLQEPASNYEIDQYRSLPSTPPQPYAFMAKLTVNDDPVLCQPGAPDGSCNRGFPRCDDPNPDNCLPTSTRCCMANNNVYDYLTGVLPGELDWNFVRSAAARTSATATAGRVSNIA